MLSIFISLLLSLGLITNEQEYNNLSPQAKSEYYSSYFGDEEPNEI